MASGIGICLSHAFSRNNMSKPPCKKSRSLMRSFSKCNCSRDSLALSNLDCQLLNKSTCFVIFRCVAFKSLPILGPSLAFVVRLSRTPCMILHEAVEGARSCDCHPVCFRAPVQQHLSKTSNRSPMRWKMRVWPFFKLHRKS